MANQSFENHAKTVPAYHFGLSLLLVLGFAGACVNLYQSLDDHQRLYSASLIVLILVALMILFWYARIFPLKAQDRAIRAEENLRHFAMTGKLLDPSLTIRQIIALRFASDGEFVQLTQRAAKENLPPKEIKRAIKSWRADEYRV